MDEQKANRFLSGAEILPRRPIEGETVVQLVERLAATGAFQGGRLGKACQIYRQMLAENTTVALTLAGAMTPAGMGGNLIELLERGFVDVIVSTGANLYHDLHFALGLKVRQGSTQVDDRELLAAGVERIYDVFITEKLLLDSDEFVRRSLESMSPDRPVTTADVHRVLGQALLDQAPFPERSVLAAAARLEVPVFTSSPGDSSIGMNIAALNAAGRGPLVNPSLDVLALTAIVHDAEKNGVVIIGGGSPKNFYLQTQPTLWQILGIQGGGHDYDIQISTDAPHWGGLSGATPSEGVSWGKINPDELDSSVVVYTDATIALPLMAAYLASSAARRPGRRLLARLPELSAALTRRAFG